ncbi:MAG: peptidoglycan editing factor PgeF [Ignavibacteriae bacterium]|nr:peptidoglycan editing factor PgeF [Ignavibacteriota bacterium]MCB9244330.1 peptidoglycan editing factor PgeF [Ignavibacteriales bacterium]
MSYTYPEIFQKFPEIKFGFSTIEGGVSSPYGMNLSLATNDEKENVLKNREVFFGGLGIPLENVNFQRQVHSDISKDIICGGFAGECDATFTNKKDVFLTVSVADCLPVFLYDPVKRIISAIHAGWRGTANKITEKTIQQLITLYGIDPGNLVTYLGPCISQEYFEVGEEVGELFSEDVKYKKGDKYHIDLKKENTSQLIRLGVMKENIEISPHCTYGEKDTFHSYRRDREMSGRMFGVIGMIS